MARTRKTNRRRTGIRRAAGLELYTLGIRRGREWSTSSRSRAAPADVISAVQEAWRKLADRPSLRTAKWPAALRLGRRFASGFWRGARRKGRLILLPLQGSAGAILAAPRATESLQSALRRLRQLPLSEIIVAIPEDSPAELLQAAHADPDVTVVFHPVTAASGAVLAVAAKSSKADTVLFVDGENPVETVRMARFVWACDRGGLDVALNDSAGRFLPFYRRNGTQRLAEFLNRSLQRRDLRAGSLTSPPFALSRKALEEIGEDLVHPARAQVAAIFSSLRVGIGGSVPVAEASSDDGVQERTAFAEAWKKALASGDSRLTFPDRARNREVLEEWT
ncbi:hypothetical protein [Cohnella caldifontis]|uniref:hypothetical protein n=1 Tax=Cohnella caldifontis TaxID=3027471 RepID=UPI0023EB3D42|nr:hypothetical protein [Cohnella sp. YIM B05605]